MTRRLDSEIIDTRDLAERLTELEEDLAEGIADTGDIREVHEIRALREEIGEWASGETLIREDYWVEYAQDLASDIGAISGEYQWPLSHIDWQAAADALAMDYSTVEYQGSTYYVRSY